MPPLREAMQAGAVGRRSIDGVDALPGLAADGGGQPGLCQQAVHPLCEFANVPRRSEQSPASGSLENFI
ncbi:hypothetical protein D3C76_1480420 [compost metagenome]